MPQIEIGKNRKGKLAILKIIRNEPIYSEDEIIGLEGYRRMGNVHISSDYAVCCGEIEKSRLLEILLENDSKVNEIKKLLT